MGRSPCCDKVGLKKGPWTPEEDQKLLAYIEEHGHGSWRALPAKAGLQRCGKSCRLRWTNYLRPDIKRGKFSLQEEQTIIQLHALLGNRWSAIATHLPKRTDNEIKNYWNTHIKKRLAKMGIDPVTHKPKTDALLSSEGQPKHVADLSHMAQWESARLEAEARLVRQSKLRSTNLPNPVLNKSEFTASPSASASSPWWPDVLKALNGAFVDELVGNSSGSCETGILKEEAEKDWKRLGNSTELPEYGDGIDNSKSFTSGFNIDQDIPCGNFEETFADLLLSGSSRDQSFSEEDGDTDNGGIVRGNNTNGREHYCEDYKNYWNSILNLVNSSPSDSPVF